MAEDNAKNYKPILVFMAGASGSGKTTVVAKLLPKLQAKGLRIGVIKHATHIQLAEAKDSTKYLTGGAELVTVVSAHHLQLTAAPKVEMPLEEVAARYYQNSAVDLIIVEGYKNTNLPKIEVLRRGVNHQLYANPKELLCVITDMPEAVPQDVPTLAFDYEDKLAGLVYAWYLEQIN